METAIPPHLQVKRTRHRRVPDDYHRHIRHSSPGISRRSSGW